MHRQMHRATSTPASARGVILGPVPRISVGSCAGQADEPHAARTGILGTSPRMTPRLGDRAVPNCRTAKNHPEQSQRVSAKDCGIDPLGIYVAAGRGILPRMTRHKHAQTGLGIPQLPQLLLTAVLRMLAMLVLHVASTLQMKDRGASVNATPTMPLDLPRAKTDTQPKETTHAVQPDSLTSAHAEQARFASRPSKHERVLTTLSTTPSVSHASRAIHLPQFSTGGGKQRIVATKGNCLHHSKSGGGGLRALARKTEGAAPRAPTPNKNAAA